ncbi:MAG: FkbM family methyltransferase [Solirubrobacterales bacterium]
MSLDSLRQALHHPDPPQLWYQIQEIVEARTYVQHGVEVHEGDIVLDVGANIGVAAAFFAEECGAGTVHCFEPVPPIFEVLRENLRAFPACIPHEYGLAATGGRRKVAYYPNDWAVSGLYADPAAEHATVRRALLNRGVPEADADARLEGRFRIEELECEFRTMSDVLEAESLEQVDLLKVDVEKSERDVLTGIADADWPRIRQVSAELHLHPGHENEPAETLRKRGFDVTVVQDPTMEGTPVHMLYAVRR